MSNSASPRRVFANEVKAKLLRPSLTSHFQCWFTVPDVTRITRHNLDRGETISLLCHEASLPGGSTLTNEINDDYTGVTERFGYRKQYDDRSDFTFYVDHANRGGYNIILLFEEWIRYSMGETNTLLDSNYFYRVNFPDGDTKANRPGYRTQIVINKFERDFFGNYLQYTFVKAYPTNITSMPISYDSSQLLKCTVSFTYNRYIVRRPNYSFDEEPKLTTPTGVPSPPPVQTPISTDIISDPIGEFPPGYTPNDFLNIGNPKLDQFGVRDSLGRGAEGTIGANIFA